MKFTSSPFKKCPRCKEKCFVHEKKCHECGLVFERLNYTSNKTAKKNILHGKRNEVLMTKIWPFDAKKLTALLLCGLLGFTGAHNFYLGRFWKGTTMLLGSLIAVAMVILSDLGFPSDQGINYYLFVVGIIPGSCALIFWITDFLNIFFERYYIPVSIDENLYNLKSNVVDGELKKDKLSNTESKSNSNKNKSPNKKKKTKSS